jgi:hypothetical protein
MNVFQFWNQLSLSDKLVILGLIFPLIAPYLWKTYSTLIRVILFLPYSAYRDRKKIKPVRFVEITPLKDYLYRWKIYILMGRYIESEKEKRYKKKYYDDLEKQWKEFRL